MGTILPNMESNAVKVRIVFGGYKAETQAHRTMRHHSQTLILSDYSFFFSFRILE
jgi:hypothetical protein